MYDKRTDTYTEDFMMDVTEVPGATEKIPGIDTQQINSTISIET
jgi:hypothetical protein